MFGQMTAGSWIYIGTQGILQGTYQTFAAAGERHFGSPDLRGRTILTAGLGGMGGAQPLAATMAGAAILCVEVDPTRIERRLETRYLDEATESLDDALARACGRRPRRGGRCRSGCSGTPRTSCPSSRAAGSTSTSSPTRRPPTTRSPATSRPGSRSRRRPRCARPIRTSTCGARASRSPRTSRALLEYVRQGSYVFDYGNNLRGEAHEAGVDGGVHIPGLRPGLYPPALLPRHRAVPLGGALGRSGRHRRDRRARSASSSRTTPSSSAGSSSHPSGSRSRDFRPGSAGSGSAIAPAPASRSTSSSAPAGSARRS